MRVIFLDFDGVLLTLRTAFAWGSAWSKALPDPVLTHTLRRVCEIGVQIVVSSSWRDDSQMCLAKLRQANLDGFLHDDWRTVEVNLPDFKSRPAEIDNWLFRHKDCEDYRILDDDDWKWLPEQLPRVLKCCPNNGADAMVIEQLLQWAGLRQAKIIA